MKTKISYKLLSVLLVAVYMATTCMLAEACGPLSIKILSPKDTIYATNSVPLTFTVNKATSWIGYSLDGQTNVTISGNITLTSLEEGAHYVVVYANDTCGNMGASCRVCFSVDTKPPDITNVCQSPPKDNVLSDDEVKVNATVTDDVSGVKRAILFYAYANDSGTWIRTVSMTNLEENIWNASIPKFPYCTNVTYTITAEDNVGNIITTVEMGYDIQYHVIPEFPSFLILPLFIVATLLVGMVYRRKHCKNLVTV